MQLLTGLVGIPFARNKTKKPHRNAALVKNLSIL